MPGEHCDLPAVKQKKRLETHDAHQPSGFARFCKRYLPVWANYQCTSLSEPFLLRSEPFLLRSEPFLLRSEPFLLRSEPFLLRLLFYTTLASYLSVTPRTIQRDLRSTERDLRNTERDLRNTERDLRDTANPARYRDTSFALQRKVQISARTANPAGRSF